MMREKDLEAKVRRYAESLGMLCWKWVSPGHDGVPDRLIINSSGAVMGLELKAPGKKASPLQLALHEELRRHGVRVYVTDSFEDAKRLLDEHSFS